MSHQPAPSPLIRVEGLQASYGDQIVLKGIDFEIEKGSIFVVLGGSGCGKSTLMKHMIGLYRPDKGKILIGDSDITQAHGREMDRLRRLFGVAYQSGALFGSMNLLDNILLPLNEFSDLPPQARKSVALLKLHLVGLSGVAYRMPSELSGGMRKRAGIARAMALDPDILFLDEPSAGLDPITSAEMDELILQLSDDLGITLVVITHELSSIYTITDDSIMLSSEEKTIIAQGTPKDLRDNSDNEWVRKFFRGEAK